MARILFGAAMNIQAPPNLAAGALPRLIAAGINDWGGVSPVTPDHVNPERPWPALDRLAAATAEAGKVLVERLAVYPDFVQRKDGGSACAAHAGAAPGRRGGLRARPTPGCRAPTLRHRRECRRSARPPGC